MQPNNLRQDSKNPTSEAQSSYFSPPQAVSLPKGGGAIKGMGEKFAANPVTGTGSMSVPIATSPGRSGFGPQLSLSYDSGAGNGMFGMGWSLSLPSITRKTDKGLPRYQDGSESDVFILSGAEDLVSILVQDVQGNWVRETLPLRTVNSMNYRIQRYRPRIEGLFARIERWSNVADSSDVHWRSISKDNILTLYGKDANSRITDSTEPHCIFSWLICETRDDRGNAILYEYQPEDGINVDLTQAHERNRGDRNDRLRTANRYLKRIHYGNRRSLLDDTGHRPSFLTQAEIDNAGWMFEVVFDYGEHDRTNPNPDDAGEWPVRNDPFSSYRAGFEVRTYRLCQRVLMFHHIPDLPNGARGYEGLVRSTDFSYSYEQNPTDARNPIYSFLVSVNQTGYNRNPEGGYIQKSLPPLVFTYSEANIDETVRDVDSESLENLPYGLDGTRYQWVDLDGEGLSGILTEQGGGWFYKRNLSPINAVKDNGSERVKAHFTPVELVASKPAIALSSGAQFLDLAGDGQLDLVTLRSLTPGFYEHDRDRGWEPFVAFKSLPNLDWDNPNLKFVDLNGDGHSDILIAEDNCFVWHPSLAEDGFAAAERVYQPWDEEKGPRVVFADSTQSIHLADMSGDGLTDIVRIRNGEVCYWPNLGYGQFGAKVTMDNAPWFDAIDIFDQQRILLADIDGSGTADILYPSRKGVQVYFNQSGNSWAAKCTLKSFPAIDNVVSVTTIDLLGNGTACLVWSSPLPGSIPRVMRYIDLMGGQKPHLLIKTVNNLGTETVVQYAPSTKFYLQDKLAGKPWITKLPFPVHVVERVETYDRISHNRFVTRYAYHHGYFDGVEREFRGFGMVEQWDTEEIGTIGPEYISSDSTNLDATSFVPPIHTKIWFHTGAYFERARLEQYFRDREYYKLDPAAVFLSDTVLPEGLTVDEERQACRALKGSMLRQEVYTDDKTAKSQHPYSVAEQNFTVKLVQSQQGNRHAVFFVHPRESLAYHYERNRADPRIGHEMVLEVDGFGNVLKSVSIVYPRRIPAYPEQARRFITYTENQVTNKPNDRPNDPDWYRIGLPIETRTYEITGVPMAFPYKLETLQVQLATATEIPYEMLTVRDVPQKRPLAWVRTLYRKDSEANTTDPTPLPLGDVDSLALPCESFKLAFTPGLLTQVYGSKMTTAELNPLLHEEGKYVQQNLREGVVGWWIPSGRQAFDASHFYLPTQIKDPFGGISTMSYDDYSLLVVESRDPLPATLTNVVKIRNHYRTLQPEQITDPNGNRAQVMFDALGMVAGTAVMGKEEETKGDLLTGFKPDLTQTEIDSFLANPLGMAAALLGKATTRIIYDLEQFKTDKQPVVAAMIARETHVSDLALGTPSKLQVSFSYSDGFGREVQKKIQAEPGDAPQREANAANPNRPGKLILENGKLKLASTEPRWVGNGRTIFNNKGKPIKQYEPFFSSTHLYENEPEMVMTGVTPILFYDPVERVVATLHPNHTYEKVVFDPWQQVTWDVNDTVLLDPKTDPDVGGFFGRLPDSDYLPTWHSQYSSSVDTEKKRAATKTAAHDGTPVIAHFDTLGRPFLTIADNGTNGKYETHVQLDIEGNQLVITDARKNPVMVQAIAQLDAQRKLVKDAQGKPILTGRANDLLGHQLYSYSMDAGERWVLNNVAGKPIRSWDSRQTRYDVPQPPKGHVVRTVYDALQRPTHLYVQPADESEILVERLVYGENHPEALQRNLKGKPFQHYDGAGVVSNWEFDFKGNLLRGSRQLAKEYKHPVNWIALAELIDIPQLVQVAIALLELRTFDSFTVFDALNRPVQLTTPDNSVMQPVYNEANLLNQVKVKLRGSQVETLFVKNIDYNAKGQRTLIEYGTGVKTTYTYDEQTFRLIRLNTTRTGNQASSPLLLVDAEILQDLNYTYDPVGNITEIQDSALPVIVYDGEQVEPVWQYTYDALYRLTQAKGREHAGQNNYQPTTPHDNDRDYPFQNLPNANDMKALRNYTESYQYDPVGNIMAMIHSVQNGGWNRTYDYESSNNRLRDTSLPGDAEGVYSAKYAYDEHGNMTQMPHLPLMQWDFKDQLQATSQQIRNDGGTPEITYFVYDASGQRVRKVTERQADAGQTPKRKSERIYLGGFELYREYNGDGTTIALERETLHIMDDRRRIALVETKTPDTENLVAAPQPIIRYQLDNHLGSASLELDKDGNVISYEEYHPYGTTSYQAGRSMAEVSLKRYRYTGKERDEETGLYYHGVRYYASWLGKWTSCDPSGFVDGTNLYSYVRNNPIRLKDATGRKGTGDEPPVIHLNLTEEQLHNLEENEKVFSQTEKAFEEDANRRARAPKSAPKSASKLSPKPAQPAAASSQSSQSTGGWLHYQSTGVGFYRKPTPGDIITAVAVNDTGSTALNIPVNAWLTLSNMVAAVINTAGNLEYATEKGAKAIGFSDTDIQAAKDITLVGEMGSLVSSIRLARTANAEVFGDFLKTLNVVSAETVTALPQAANWESRVPGVQLGQSEGWWMKRVNPDANPLMRWWGERSIKAQSEGLDKLGGLATPHVYVDGTLYTKDVGQALPGSFRLLNPLSRSTYIQGSMQMGTFFNDIQPRNMGANGLVFDPAIDPVTKTIFWGGAIGIGAGTSYAVSRQ